MEIQQIQEISNKMEQIPIEKLESMYKHYQNTMNASKRYIKKRYENDEEFREKLINKSRNYYYENQDTLLKKLRDRYDDVAKEKKRQYYLRKKAEKQAKQI